MLKTELAQATSLLMGYQSRWIADTAPVKIIEKSRRIGISYAEAADDVLYAASAEGANVYYISYNKEMTAGFIQDCATWARASVITWSGASPSNTPPARWRSSR